MKFIKALFLKLLLLQDLTEEKSSKYSHMCIRNLKEIFPKIKYIIIGDGEENNLIKLVKELKIDNEVALLSKIDDRLKKCFIKKI